jgi:hypothetical protein
MVKALKSKLLLSDVIYEQQAQMKLMERKKAIEKEIK